MTELLPDNLQISSEETAPQLPQAGTDSTKRFRTRSGFTAIEFLTSVSIIFILLTILLPAIFRTREMARASQCLNNMKQLSLAMHNYHAANGTFPPGYISIMGIKGNELENEWAWGALMLPYLDQSPLYLQIDFSTSVAGRVGEVESDFSQSMAAKASNGSAAQTNIPPFRCTYDEIGSNASKVKPLLGLSSYSGVIGVNWAELPCATIVKKLGETPIDLLAEPCLPQDGAFYLNSRVRLKDVRDGTSQTMFLAETSGRLDYPIEALAANRSDETLLWGGTYWASVLNPLAQDHVLTATSAGINQPDKTGFSSGINSWHTGGAHVAFIDGSVRKLSNQIDSDRNAPYGVLQRISTIAGGDLAFEF